jgi:deoxyribodipyrimidine photolyase-like uncharacterized protein
MWEGEVWLYHSQIASALNLKLLNPKEVVSAADQAYVKGCRFNPGVSVGENACPFTTLYWDYLNRHVDVLAKNPRMLMQLKNLNRLSNEERAAIAAQAKLLTNSYI